MENFSVKANDRMELPPGFRFHPTDEELITHYLSEKVVDSNFSATAIGEADMNMIEPWDLPWRAKWGEREWYFFCVRDKKYPTGLRTNRATAAGYWKATGKDREIFRGKSLVGMKKTLVFYKGRAPQGERSNWVSHEYRLEGQFSLHNLPKTAKNEWVICRVFKKGSGGKKVHISGLMSSSENEMAPTALPPLMDPSLPSGGTIVPTITESIHVPFFSNIIDIQKSQDERNNYFNNPVHPFPSNASDIFQRISLPNSYYRVRSAPVAGILQYPAGTFPMQDQAILRGLLENYDSNIRQNFKTEKETGSVSQETGLSTEISSVVSNLDMGRRSFEDQKAPSTSVEALDFDCLWSY